MSIASKDLSHWPQLELVARVEEGNRNEVWRARMGDMDVAVRQSRRSDESLNWELDFIEFLTRSKFVVAEVVPTRAGERHREGVVVQRWIDGVEPSSREDWMAVSDTLRRVHALTADYPQRPGCCTALELVDQRRSIDADLDQVPEEVADTAVRIFTSFVDSPTSAIHGDPDESNLRMLADGRVGLLDLDESRVDITALDLSNLGAQTLPDDEHARGVQLSHAWEAVNGWIAEPDYARRRYQSLLESLKQ